MVVPSGAIVIEERFLLEARIGAGGMGEVYRARDLHLQLPVAIKLLRGEARPHIERFLREGAILAQLAHPAIVRYLGHGIASDGRPYLAMEWLEGETVDERLRRGPLSAQETYRLARRISGGLGVAHAGGIAHRDLKPSNIFLVGGAIESAKILDFGIAKRLFEAHGQLTRTGGQLGTPAYMSPEQARGTSIDVRTDVFSLGAMLYECLAGRAPFQAENLLAMAAEICLQDPPWPHTLRPDVPLALEQLVMRLMQKDRALRPENALHVARELAELGEPTTSAAKDENEAPSLLANSEQRVISVVVAQGLDLSDETLVETEVHASAGFEELRGMVASFDAQLERLGNGMMLACFTKAVSARDQIVRAAALALKLGTMYPSARLALCHGRAVLQGRLPIGAVVERGTALIPRAERGVALDAAAAELLDGAAFYIESRDHGAFLMYELDADEPVSSFKQPFVGRTLEQNLLTGMFAACIDEGTACGAIVMAPPGLGKSRLAREVLRELAQRQESYTLLVGQGDPFRISAPFGLLSALVRRAAGITAADSLEQRRQRLRALLATAAPKEGSSTSVEFMGELSGIPFPDDHSPALRSARNDPRLMNEQIRAVFLTFLGEQLAHAPTLMLVEDLHWADLPSVQLIESAMRTHDSEALCVIALARPEVRERFPQLFESACFQAVTLKRLPARAAERLVRELLGRDADDALVRRLVAHADGSPFFLQELMRSARSGAVDSLPDTIMAMIQARLDELGLEASRVLRAASVFGECFSHSGVRALTGESDERLSEYWTLFETRELTLKGVGGAQQFRHALVRDTCYAALTPGDRTLGHRLAGEFLSRSTDTDPAVLAQHFDHGGAKEQAIPEYVRAAAHALQGEDYAAALSLAARGAALGASGESLAELRAVELQAHAKRLELVEAERAGREALALAREGSAIWYTVIREIVEPLTEQMKLDQVVAFTELALEVATRQLGEAVSDPSLRSVRLSCLSWVAGAASGAQGNVSLTNRVFAVCERELEQSEDTLEAWALARFHNARGSHRSWNSMLAEALSDFERALELATRAGDAPIAWLARINAGQMLLEMGMAERGADMLRPALRTNGDASKSIPALALEVALANVRFLRGDAAGARDDLRKLFKRHEMPRFRSLFRLHIARYELALGDLAAAEREIRALLDEASDLPMLTSSGHSILAQVLLAAQLPGEALEHALAGWAELQRTGSVQDYEGLVPLMAAEALRENGRDEEAREALAEAHTRLMRRANAITDAELRHSFLHRISEHSRTLELVREWGLAQS